MSHTNTEVGYQEIAQGYWLKFRDLYQGESGGRRGRGVMTDIIYG